MAALPQFMGQNRCELGLPVAPIDLFRSSIMAEHDAAVKKHLGQVPQGQAVAQAPQHHQRDHVARILGPVQHSGAALIELRAAVPAAETAIALGGPVPPLGYRHRPAAHAFHPELPIHPPIIGPYLQPPPLVTRANLWRER